MRTALLFLLAALSCNADLTIRYTMDAKPGTGLPPALADQVMKQVSATMPKERVLRIQGDKTFTAVGLLNAIVDNTNSALTLLDPAKKQYAKMSTAEFLAAMQTAVPSSPAAQKALEQMKFDVQTKETGETTTVLGIPASERILTLSMSMETPAAITVRMEVHTWVATADDLGRIPALKQYADRAQRSLTASNPADAIENMFSQMPGFAAKLGAAANGLKMDPGSLAIKTQMVMFMALPGFPAAANSPLMEMDTVLADVSSDAIDPGVFEVPSDYQEISSADIVKAMRPTVPAAAPKPVAVVRPPLDPTERIYRVGNGVSASAVTFKVDPNYSEEARTNKIEGSVRLSIVVDNQGLARNVQVIESLGHGLDEEAILAVNLWKFRPGQKDGEPVNTRATVVVNFRLEMRPAQQE